ncbi:phage repressor protein CI [Cronobacter sakazakii]|uniref:phage repressor protein CI n=1 Tax=Cronobacter sakazakii TaxID=28141 RepID=UPI000A19770F|nr:phage repressor protein CI [Cronobacter sakazakii]RWT63072.1 phage repressor protein [Enterobacter cloacae]EGT5207535.1 phage repressor protein [Cronobacter sakazakii]EGT5755239.1 phage repressor protein [Cronobacter sakazakii]EGZ6858538.1 phage repressor protein [Cronobacter sakazakii]EGZ6867470.1 phage repressor protein [Cronobacter sakazakii]
MRENGKFTLPTDSAAVLDRVCEAYGFGTSLQLADHLDMAASSMSARRKRGVFPADIVVQCVLETGANLEWLTTGVGNKFNDSELDILKLQRKKLVDGQMYDAGYVMFDKAFFRAGVPIPSAPFCLHDENKQYIVDCEYSEIYDGEWLVNIEGKIGTRSLVRIPIRKVRVSGTGMAFDCALEDIDVIGRIVMTITN